MIIVNNKVVDTKGTFLIGGGGALMLEAQEADDGTVSWVDEFNWETITAAVEEGRQVAVRVTDPGTSSSTYYLLTIAEPEDGRLVFSRPVDAYTVQTLWVTLTGFVSKSSSQLGAVRTVNGEHPDEFGNVNVIGGGSVDLSNYYNKEEVDDKIGDISSALDELHAYAEALKGGGAV